MNQLEKAVADLRHAYHQLTEGVVKDQSKFADGLIAPAIYRIEQALKPGEPVGEAYLCDACGTPFDGAHYCPKCKHNTATKEPVYTVPQPQLNLNCKSVQKRLAEQWGFAPQPQPKQEPVAYQYRMRPTWGNKEAPWGPWEECNKGKHDDCKRTPLLHDWQYEVRELYAAPQPQPDDTALLRQALEALEPSGGCVDDDGCGYCQGCRADAAIAALRERLK